MAENLGLGMFRVVADALSYCWAADDLHLAQSAAVANESIHRIVDGLGGVEGALDSLVPQSARKFCDPNICGCRQSTRHDPRTRQRRINRSPRARYQEDFASQLGNENISGVPNHSRCCISCPDD